VRKGYLVIVIEMFELHLLVITLLYNSVVRFQCWNHSIFYKPHTVATC